MALAATDRPLHLRIQPIEDEHAPEGMACLGSFLGPKLVARCVLPPDAAAFLLDRGLFAQPVRLALAAREEPPGLQCQLFALVELPPDFWNGEEGDEPTPWAGSLPGASYDRIRSVQAGEEPLPDDEGEGEDERQAAVFLGQIIRFDKDRRHPGDLALETMDVLRTIVQGELSEVVDKVLEDLLKAPPPDSPATDEEAR